MQSIQDRDFEESGVPKSRDSIGAWIGAGNVASGIVSAAASRGSCALAALVAAAAAVGVAVVMGSALIAPVASAQVPLLPDEVERIDVIAVERDGRELFAFDALTGRRPRIDLEIDEEVLLIRTRGRIGIVLTDRRVLGVAAGTPWIEERLRLQETATDRGLVESRIALVVTDRRALAFTGGAGWIEEDFGPQEGASSIRAGAAAGVVTTNRRALGIAPSLQRFVSESLRVREVLESVTAQDTLVTLRTDRRILVFSAPRANWSEQKRRIR